MSLATSKVKGKGGEGGGREGGRGPDSGPIRISWITFQGQVPSPAEIKMNPRCPRVTPSTNQTTNRERIKHQTSKRSPDRSPSSQNRFSRTQKSKELHLEERSEIFQIDSNRVKKSTKLVECQWLQRRPPDNFQATRANQASNSTRLFLTIQRNAIMLM